jgi:hypothetical protein
MKRLLNPIISIALAIGGIAMLWPSLRVCAFNPQPDPPVFGLIGVDPLSTVRLNAVCPDTQLPGGVNPGPCTVDLEFRDTHGNAIKRITETALPGHGVWLDLSGAQLGRGRTEVQPFVPAVTSGFIVLTAEVFDDLTGRTIATLNPTEPRSLSSSQ